MEKVFTGSHVKSLQWKHDDILSMRNFFIMKTYSAGLTTTMSMLNICDKFGSMKVGEILYIAPADHTVFFSNCLETLNSIIKNFGIDSNVNYNNGWYLKKTESRFVARLLDYDFE